VDARAREWTRVRYLSFPRNEGVIEEEDAWVFLEPEAASLLDDKVLDATVEESKVAFTIADQAAA
jgi:hypothetical protein